jgi:rSAM/selenodomain-associated transferase 2
MRLAIIVPVLNEALAIEPALQRLQALRARGAILWVVDGGSHDATAARAAPLADHVLASPRGRSMQMNAGAAAALHAGADTLLFLHADTELPADADRLIAGALENSGRSWGRFDVRIVGRSPLLRLVASGMNWRSRATGICTGDQAIFMRGELFEKLGGYAPIALMEDIDLSRRARRVSRPAALRERVLTSGRRWDERGTVRTIAQMWLLRLAFFVGADPARLARIYRDVR